MSKEQVTFEVRPIFDNQNMVSRGIFIDGEHFDWGVDEDHFKEAAEQAKKLGGQTGALYLKSIQDSIQKHFLESISEFMGRRVTADEVNKAQTTGLIDK
jgi:hypothetical protein